MEEQTTVEETSPVEEAAPRKEPSLPPIKPNPKLLKELEVETGINAAACYQCRKCTNGCPLTFLMDILPNRMMRSVQLGLRDEVLRSHTIWVCASCETCTTRCPNDIDVARVMDTLRRMSLRAGIEPAEPDMVKFHRSFLDTIRIHGRAFEVEMIGRYKVRTGQFTKDMGLGMEMFKKGKLKLLPKRIKDRKAIREIFKNSRERSQS